MHIFKDADGREWTVTVNVGTVKKLRALGCDIMAEDGGGINSLASDPVALAEAIWMVCEEQGQKRSITDSMFYSSLGGDSIEAATDAMINAIIDFFPSARKRLLQKAMDKSRTLKSEMIRRAEKKIDEMGLESVTNLPESAV
jgi:NAD/NADP transhydrogenase alpha subunit